MKEYLILKIQEYLISHSSGIINFAQIHNPTAKRLFIHIHQLASAFAQIYNPTTKKNCVKV